MEKAGKKVVLLGNEAVARGALEAGLGFCSAYPGTPSSEVPMTFSAIAKQAGIYFEWATNEKVAFEAAAGAAWCGVKSMTTMKQFGLNVASDSVCPVVYMGVRGGMVLMVADDPGGLSSAQSEQDTRHFARMARLPVIEPSNPQECLDFTKLAFQLSEEFEIPVMLRTTTKVSHAIASVRLGKMPKARKLKGTFKHDPKLYYNIKPALQELHRKTDRKLEAIEKKYGVKFNQSIPGKGMIGIITSGVSYDYTKEALRMLGLKPPMAKISLTHPLSEKFIQKFIKGKQAVLVVEELEPVVEGLVKQLAKDVNPKLKVHGKDLLEEVGEFNMEIVMPVLEKVFKKRYGFNFEAHKKKVDATVKSLAPRKPVLCQGCPHRSTFYAIKKAYGGKAVYAGDIGCYTLGVFEPFDMQNFIVSMGSGAGLAHGITKVSDQDVVAFMGDSTFFHAGMPPIANLRFNDGRAPLIVVLDNAITAMTGHQPHPGSGITGMGETVSPIKIEEVVKGMGVSVEVASAFSQKDLLEKIGKLKKIEGAKVLVSRGECRLLTRRNYRQQGIKFIRFQINQEACKKCGECTDRFACPAIKEVRRKKGDTPVYTVDLDLCWGCSVCAQVCPHHAIHAVQEGKK